MSYLFLCLFVLFAAYLVNISYMSVFYHRGLTHNAVKFRPWMRKFVIATGPWMTGLDPKVWACMHRMHHLYSDTAKDPHSPVNVGVLGVLLAQKNNYCDITTKLIAGRKDTLAIVPDLDFPVNWISRHKLDLAPYVLHGLIAIGVGFLLGGFWVGACYFVGMVSHPLQGWMVNAFGHHSGYRNFDTPDHSTNNYLVSLFVLGEGYQNNHHAHPESASFAAKWWEIDFGYIICRLAKAAGLLVKVN